MATTNKLQLKMTLSNGKSALINLPEAKADLSASDLTGAAFGKISAVYETDELATVTNIAVSKLVTTTTSVSTAWNSASA